jgi:cellulose synthase/poly-beta-1,6-N-acetylglucosamine synthase-like glycosyltransferase
MPQRTMPRLRSAEKLGNQVCGVWPYVVSVIANAILQVVLYVTWGYVYYGIPRMIISFIFFIYPFYFITDVLWSMRPTVAAILAGERRINRKHYMNVARTDVPVGRYPTVTASIPVYLEQNAVIFQTVRDALRATERYRNDYRKPANVVISDDGIAQLLHGAWTPARADALIARLAAAPQTLTVAEYQVAERLWFYRKHGIGFVARPVAGRVGRFKKASNLNYTMRVGDRLAAGAALSGLIGPGADFEGGYAEGDVITHDVILLLDKDSGVAEEIIGSVVPEFVADDKLAYVQCATRAANLTENFFTKAVGYLTNNLFHNIWPCKALQGYFVPLVGHNVFLNKAILQGTGSWSQDRVSEDYDKAIRFYNAGYHGKYAQLAGLEFTEYVSRTFAEETGKQLRYSYGLLEMLLRGTIQLGLRRHAPERTRACDLFYMILYFCSIVNASMLLPWAVFESLFGNMDLLWAGFVFCNACFILLPYVRSQIMRYRIPAELQGNLGHTTVLALSYLGHAYSMLAGIIKFFVHRVLRINRPFAASNVDRIEHRFVDGVKVLGDYFRKNKGFLVAAVVCVATGIYALVGKNLELPTLLTFGYVFFVYLLVPVLLTPQVYVQPVRTLRAMMAGTHRRMNRLGRAGREFANRNAVVPAGAGALVAERQSLSRMSMDALNHR